MVAVIMREGARAIEKDYVEVAKFYKIPKKRFFMNFGVSMGSYINYVSLQSMYITF